MPTEETIVSLPEPQPPFVYFSPTLAALRDAGRPLPSPLPACASCPASGWYTTTKGLACYCTSYGRTVWNKVLPPVTACDGREKALARLAVEAAI
ncbi:MAG: hypothetical protein V4537_06110 [Pseudomonadota bacterium]